MPTATRSGCPGKQVLCAEDSLSSLLHRPYFCCILLKAHPNTPSRWPESIEKPTPQRSQNTEEILWDKYSLGVIINNIYFQVTSM